MKLFNIIVLIAVVYCTIDYYSNRGYQNDQLTQLRTLATEAGIKHIDVFLQQAAHETDWFRSRVFKTHNNLQGMMCNKFKHCKCSTKNITCKDGTYCHYDTLQYSVLAYKAWQTRKIEEYVKIHGKGTEPLTKEQYYYFLCNLTIGKSTGHRYATDPHYISKLRARGIQIDNLRLFPII